MAIYTRTTTIDSGPTGDSVKQAVLDLDTDLTGHVAAYNAHDVATTSVHGFTGTKTGSGAMVGATTPTLVTPVLGVATATSINKVAITAPATGSTLTVADGKTLTASATMTLTGTDATQLSLAGNLTTSGAYATTLTTTNTTSVTLPTSGTLVSSVTTGNGVSATNTAGALAFTLGAITPSTVNGVTLASGTNTFSATVGTASLDIAAGSTLNIDKSLTVDGFGTTITGAGQANTVTLNESFTVGDGFNVTATALGQANTLTMNESLTVGDGYNVTLTALGQPNALTLNESLTLGDGFSGTLTYSAASKTLTVESTSIVNQDLTTDATPTFATVKLTTGASSGYLLTSAADGTASWAAAATSGVPRSYLAGLKMTNAADTDHDITIAVGTARDSSNTYDLTLASAMTKRIDAGWAAGSTNGGMATGSVANDTWYHVHLIRKTSDASIDAMFDTSVTASHVPTGYVAYRRIGSVQTDGSANIKQFVQDGDMFRWVTPVLDVSETNSGATALTRTLLTPLGVRTLATMNVYVESGGGEYAEVYFSDLSLTDSAASTAAAPLASTGAALESTGWTGQVETMTSTSSTIRTRHKGTGSGSYFKICTIGYTDRRGRDD